MFSEPASTGSKSAVIKKILLASHCSQVASMPASKEKEVVTTSVYNEEFDFATKEDSGGRVYFVLEESSGYMEPSLQFLAVAHTIISFCCIIGYYCLKVQFE